MEEQLVSRETAELAKEKGFNQNPYVISIAYLPKFTDGSGVYLRSSLFSPENNICVVPTQSLLQKWLRDEHDLHYGAKIIRRTKESGLKDYFRGTKNDCTLFEVREYTYEDALEKSLQIGLTLI